MTTTTSSKLTNSKALDFVLTSCDLPADVAEKLTKLKASIDKKSTAERKPTATQVANAGFKDAIVDFLSVCGERKTVSEIIKECPAVADLSNQRVSAIVRQLKDEGAIVRIEDKRKAYFAVPSAE